MTPPGRCNYSAVRIDTDASSRAGAPKAPGNYLFAFKGLRHGTPLTAPRDFLARLSQSYWVCGTQDGRSTEEKKTHRDAQESPVKESDL